MSFEVSQSQVLSNLERFKESLAKMPKFRAKQESIHRVLLNRRTGEMRFAKTINTLGEQIGQQAKSAEGDWKEIQIVVQLKSDGVHFEAKDGKHHRLESTDLETRAWSVANETLDVLNEKGRADRKKVRGEMLPEEVVLQDLSEVRLAKVGDRIEEHAAWKGPLSRDKAELLLEGMPVGTYLLRKGEEITKAVSFHLGEDNHLHVEPFVMTVVEEDEKISDILLLRVENRGWIVYSDQPDLGDLQMYKYEVSADALINSLAPIAKYPLV